MDDRKRNLKGSEKRDTFKQKHKNLDRGFYATDVDFCLISKHPPGTVAYLDYKDVNDNVTFTEAIQYNAWISTTPVFIVESTNPEAGPFLIRRYLGADWKPNPPVVEWGEEVVCMNWEDFEKWERSLRQEYRKRGGWNGNLKSKLQPD